MGLARSLFDDDIHVAEADPDVFPYALFPEESAQIERAIEKRAREYGVARTLFRGLLPHLGLGPVALVNDDKRAPQWPEGVLGTITHTQSYCGVAIASTRDVLGLGLDAERAGPLKQALWKSICTPEELAMLHGMSEDEAGELGKLIFSAKECAYKAQYARSRTFLGFQAMRIDVDDTHQRFRATFEQSAGDVYAPGDVIDGRFLRTETLVLTSVTIRR
jgi:4'-phosphopantetheinyl transferase EntD